MPDYRGHLPEGAAIKLASPKLTRIASASVLIFPGTLALAQKRRTQWPGFHDRRSRGKLGHARHLADHGKLDEAEPER
jgi:hypothetical protein